MAGLDRRTKKTARCYHSVPYQVAVFEWIHALLDVLGLREDHRPDDKPSSPGF